MTHDETQYSMLEVDEKMIAEEGGESLDQEDIHGNL
jgi:hypothetical protein